MTDFVPLESLPDPWWRDAGHRPRQNRDFLTKEEKVGLLAEMVLCVYDSGDGDIVDRGDTRPIDEVIDLSGIPDFDAVKRDW